MLEYSWTTERIARLAALVILVLACLQIILPFLGALTWAGIIAMTVWPAFLWLAARLGNRPRLAAALFTLALTMVVVFPLAVLVTTFGEAVPQVAAVARDLASAAPPDPPAWLMQIPIVGQYLEEGWRRAVTDMAGLLRSARPTIEKAAIWTLAQGAQLGLALLEFFFAIIIAGVFLISADRSALWAQRVIAKIQVSDGTRLIGTVVSTVRSVSIGVVGTAIVQALLVAIGFLSADVPGVVVLGFLSFFLALVQLPTLLVWGPACLWLYHQGEGGWALFLLIWGLALVNPIDNFLRPYLISQEAKLPIALIFIGVVGGLIAWGIIGLFIGPTLLAVAHSLFRTWTGPEQAAESWERQEKIG